MLSVTFICLLSTANAFRISHLAKRDSSNNMVASPKITILPSLPFRVYKRTMGPFHNKPIGGKAHKPRKKLHKVCRKIIKKCKDAGFIRLGSAQGKGLYKHCIYPILTGKNQPKDAVIKLPNVKKSCAKTCIENNPELQPKPKCKKRNILNGE